MRNANKFAKELNKLEERLRLRLEEEQFIRMINDKSKFQQPKNYDNKIK